MKKFLLAIIVLMLIFERGYSQGCVAIRSTGGFCSAMNMSHNTSHFSKWSFGINNRYFKSYKHFVGTTEQKQRVDQGTEVINYSYTMDILITRHLNQRWSLNLDMPIISNARS